MYHLPMVLLISLLTTTNVVEDRCATQMQKATAELGSDHGTTLETTGEMVYSQVWIYPSRFLKVRFEWSAQNEKCIETRQELESYKNEPDGFRDLKWGADFKSVKGLVYLLKDDRDIKFYERKKDALSIGDAKIEAIAYGFWKGKLCSVFATFNGQRNWEIVKGSLFERFGPGRDITAGLSLGWNGPKTIIIAQYNSYSAVGSLLMQSAKVQRDMEKLLDKAINDGAKSGF